MTASWTIEQSEFDFTEAGKYETIFALANGRLGVRGTLDDGRSVYHSGTFLNGFYDSEPISYGEIAYGYPQRRQRMLNVTDGTMLDLWVNDDPFDLSTGTLVAFRRWIDLREGVLHAHYEWLSPGGVLLHLDSERVVPMTRRATVGIRYSITLPEESAVVTILSGINSREKADEGGEDPRVGTAVTRNALTRPKRELTHEYAVLGHTTRYSGFRLVCAMGHTVCSDDHVAQTAERHVNDLRHRFVFHATVGVTTTVEKFVVYEHAWHSGRVKLTALAKRSLTNARTLGITGLMHEQREYLSGFWEIADIEIAGAAEVQESIRFNLFHVLQAAGRDGRTNVGAKGLTGEGYEGHYFWDTEIYLLPLFTYLVPETARKLVEFRHTTLPQARRRARELSHRGALFPWRTINGNEASAFFLAGTAQYHINADIVYAARRYAYGSGNLHFLHSTVAEIAVETARFWLSLGDHVEQRGFCINGVTGPDEYTALVNNNVYTNLMARDNLWLAAELCGSLQADYHDEWMALQHSLASDPDGEGEVGESEIRAWQRAADEMYIPYDPHRRLYPQDDSFFQKARWNFDQTPPHAYPLLLHYHPLTIYRYQVLKQPDLVMALFLQGTRFTADEIRRNFLYYDPLTTGDSSLSACIQSIIAAQAGEIDLSYHYFLKTVRMDLDDVNGNVKDGVHAAAMAGTWLSIVYGYGGFRDYEARFSFDPHLPTGWKRLRFRLRIRHFVLTVTVRVRETSYHLSRRGGGESDRISFLHRDLPVHLVEGETVRCPNGER